MILNSNTRGNVTFDADVSSNNTTRLIMVPQSLYVLRSETRIVTGETTVTQGNTTNGENNSHNTPSPLEASDASSASAMPIVGRTTVPSVREGNTTHQENDTLHVLSVSNVAGEGQFVTPTASTVSTNKAVIQKSATDTQNQQITTVLTAASSIENQQITTVSTTASPTENQTLTTASTTASPTTTFATTQQPKATWNKKGRICALLRGQRLPLPASCQDAGIEPWNR
ncbi:uncharacterized protein LOC127859339 [Dreissena polymorpha]|uniref:uncharacterized protein LOC127859339 n=1 Tax=Dreissena polymorpha TaxID=45954 RepID=UPI002264E797|nr:uncharacterized protein LOC127859339 [Dreissena polymorpha]